MNDFKIDINQSWFIGDSETDVEAGKSVGCKTLLISPELNFEQSIENILHT
jgi:histidinol phosphatase-like enzyme